MSLLDTMEAVGNQYRSTHPLPRRGDQFGRWTVTKIGGVFNGHRMVYVRCECGTKKQVSWPNLRRGLTRSCGCLHSEVTAARNHARGVVPRFTDGWIPDREQLAWAAGFFDGEGNTSGEGGRSKYRPSYRPVVQVGQSGSPVELERFRSAVGGLGNIKGPYWGRKLQRLPIYVFSANGFEKVQAIIALLWPWLSEVKRAQAVGHLLKARERRS